MKVVLLITLVSLLLVKRITLLLGIGALPRQFDIAEDENIFRTLHNYVLIINLRVGPVLFHQSGFSPQDIYGYRELIDNITLRVGATEFDQTENEAITLAKLYIHPLYNDTTVDYDISILLLNKNLAFGKKINSVALPLPNVVLPAGTMATVVGWGMLTVEGALPTQLQVVTLPIISNEECARRYVGSNDTWVFDRNLCAGYPQGGKDACNGDSGGPLTVNGVLYGLVSSGTACADARFPGTYTNVSSVRSYITSITGL
ncbi:trypsin-7-like [Agrilus planipennis]|uniref:Trypsin-7-like n=1 Tax=Agrilus planipennis TaxID=224129 RepID=A0A7F5RI38_AGRPL|nr:trypsin-7-like [Agrilus planipennis]